MPSSCHPKTTTKSIPYSLSLRIVRICTQIENRDKRLEELRQLLLERNYPEKIINMGIEKAKKVPRKIALMKVRKKTAEARPVFALKFDPRIPAIEPMVGKHWRSMKVQDKYLGECFKQPPLIAYKRQRNIRDFLIKSKIPAPPKPYSQRNKKGMSKCGKSCTACPYIAEGKSVKIDKKNTWNIEKHISCNTYNSIYLLQCKKENCRQRYIGTSGRQLKFRLADHRGYILNQVVSKATGAHFNLPGHSLAQLSVTILEQTQNNSEEYRKEREKYFIRRFDTYNNGINREW